jgi:hypothetical protein
MKYAITLLIFILILMGCESEVVTNEKASHILLEADIEHYINELDDANRKISEIEKTNRQLTNTIVEMQEKFNNDSNKHSRAEELIKKVTQLEKFEYEILSDTITRSPYDAVVLVLDVPDTLDEQEIYVIRSAIEFSGDKFTKVSLWKDRQAAMKYINNDYDPEDGFDGWRGFDQQFGFIDNTRIPPMLTHFFSKHDAQVIEFGKYTYEK